MPKGSQPVGNERGRANGNYQGLPPHVKLARFFGVVAGNAGNLRFEGDLTSNLGTSFDWDPWIRYLQPDFAVIMSAERNQGVRWPTAIVFTDTGRIATIDRRNCHPSDAAPLVNGENMKSLEEVISALETSIHTTLDGDRVTSALATVRQLRRICRLGQ